MLHVDDDEWQLNMMRDFLRTYDSKIEVDSLLESIEVLGKLRSNLYDCLITDFKMPIMNGIELAREIRKESSIPIILYTGQGSDEVAEEAFSVGINDYFRKETTPQHYQVIAKRIRNIAEKQRTERVYTNIVQDAKDSIVILVKEKIVFVNDAFLKLICVSSEKDILGSSYLDLISSEQKKVISEELSNLIQGKITQINSELDIKRRDRKKIPVEVTSSVIDYLGQKAILCFLKDISDRKALENKIKSSEIKYRSLVELAPDGIVTIALNGNVTWINEEYTAITGYTTADIVGKKIWSLKTVRPTDIGKFVGLFLDLIRGGSVPAAEFQWVSKDGDVGWGEGRASLIKNDNKKTEVLLSLRDITERKQMEDELRKYSQNMEYLAEQRAKLLLESEKMVIAGTIASTVAHDLRGPLNTIVNAVYLMDIKPEKSAEMRAIILKAVDNASKMLSEARSKTITPTLNLEDIDLVTFIDAIIEETPIPKHIEVKTNLSHEMIRIDKLKMRRVIENLIRNAVEAMHGMGKLDISGGAENDQIVIKIKDSGVGIPKENLGTLFT
ncbi:MAG: PAS domain S-box protein, partial [Candidatus Bathyarchaeota archaeon]|nr:PAS domain S-box protein [Candidatus Bathyarchaeota archaeon]